MQSIRITLRASPRAWQSIRKYKKKSMDRHVADSSRSKKKSITLRASPRAWQSIFIRMDRVVIEDSSSRSRREIWTATRNTPGRLSRTPRGVRKRALLCERVPERGNPSLSGWTATSSKTLPRGVRKGHRSPPEILRAGCRGLLAENLRKAWTKHARVVQ